MWIMRSLHFGSWDIVALIGRDWNLASMSWRCLYHNAVTTSLMHGECNVFQCLSFLHTIKRHFSMYLWGIRFQLISSVCTQLVTCLQNCCAASREGQILAASSANRVQPTVKVDFCHVLLWPVGTRAPCTSVPFAKSLMKMLNSKGKRGHPCQTPQSSQHKSWCQGGRGPLNCGQVSIP